MKPPKEGDIWDRIGHTEPKLVINEVLTILIVRLYRKLRRLVFTGVTQWFSFRITSEWFIRQNF